MGSTLIQNARLVNEGSVSETDIYIENGRFHTLGSGLKKIADLTVDAAGKWAFPGLIDDQVHFREPGLTHEGEIATESRAAVAGGITSFMEMPNVKPPTLTQALLAAKYQRAAEVSPANYSFYMGVANDNLAEVLKTDPRTVCGLKIFMGSSTGNLLVDDEKALEEVFAKSELLIATHCEDEATVRANEAAYRDRYGAAGVTPAMHPEIRNVEACWLSSSKAVALAQKHGTRLHILHISTAKELDLFRNDIPTAEKRITAEACLHHLWFSDADYATLGHRIRWNPAVKTAEDRAAIRQAVLDGRIDVLATDHAPHAPEEKFGNDYFHTPSGGPLVQHWLVGLLELVHQGVFPVELIAEKAAHRVADCFQLAERGYVREGYWADLVLVDPAAPWTVTAENLRYKCGWSPFEGQQFQSRVTHTFVNGELAYQNGQVDENARGMRLAFNR